MPCPKSARALNRCAIARGDSAIGWATVALERSSRRISLCPQASIRCEMSCYMQMGPELGRRGHDNAFRNGDIKAAGLNDAGRASLPPATTVLAGRIRPIRATDPRHEGDPAARHRTFRPGLGSFIRQGAGIYPG